MSKIIHLADRSDIIREKQIEIARKQATLRSIEEKRKRATSPLLRDMSPREGRIFIAIDSYVLGNHNGWFYTDVVDIRDIAEITGFSTRIVSGGIKSLHRKSKIHVLSVIPPEFFAFVFRRPKTIHILHILENRLRSALIRNKYGTGYGRKTA